MAKIEFGFSQKDVYDFVIKNEVRKTVKENGVTITEKLRKPIFKNTEIDCWDYTTRMTADNSPKALKNVEYFTAPNPFGKFGDHIHYEPYGWTFAMCILAFKKGYIDGFFGRRGLFSFGTSIEGIVVVDPIQRIEVRKWVEEEYKEYLDKCNEEDFEYAVQKDDTRKIGKEKGTTYEDVLNDYIKEKEEGREFFKTKREKECVAKYGFDNVLKALAGLCYYTLDIWNLWGQRTADPLTFKTKEDAIAFSDQWDVWSEHYYDGDERSSKLEITIVNEKFDEFCRDKVEVA